MVTWSLHFIRSIHLQVENGFVIFFFFCVLLLSSFWEGGRGHGNGERIRIVFRIFKYTIQHKTYTKIFSNGMSRSHFRVPYIFRRSHLMWIDSSYLCWIFPFNSFAIFIGPAFWEGFSFTFYWIYVNGIYGMAMLNFPMFVVLKCDYTGIYNVRDALQYFNLHFTLYTWYYAYPITSEKIY